MAKSEEALERSTGERLDLLLELGSVRDLDRAARARQVNTNDEKRHGRVGTNGDGDGSSALALSEDGRLATLDDSSRSVLRDNLDELHSGKDVSVSGSESGRDCERATYEEVLSLAVGRVDQEVDRVRVLLRLR